MCGIVGYIGKRSALKPVINGLKALEYRGYDSAGIAVLSKETPVLIKQAGRVEALEGAVQSSSAQKGHVGIGHTRWATHGAPTTVNAHPHHNAAKTIFVAHNGIIENYQKLRDRLQNAGYAFASETDTEVIPHLIDFYMSTSDSFKDAFELAVKDLSGAFAICAIYAHEPRSIYVARLSSPLVIGVGKREHFLASDATAIMEHTKKVIYLDDFEIARITESNVSVHNFKDAADVKHRTEELEYDHEQALLGDYPNFMLKEINEGPQTIQAASRGRIRAASNVVKLGGLDNVAEQLQFIDRIIIVGCGTSYYAGLIGERLIEEIAGIPVEVQLASEFKYRDEPFSRSTALLAISQSGETADTIAAIKKVENYGMLRLGIVNAVGSTIARITDAGVYCHAGPELSVASTKAFIAQVTVLTEIALYLSQGKTPLYKPLIRELALLPDKAKAVLEQSNNIKSLAQKYADSKNFLFLGRGYAYPCALEGALKLKELSYIHAEGCAAGEIKHGSLAMIDKNFPTLAIACKSPMLEKTLSNIEEIKARGGPVIAIATKGDTMVKRKTDDVIYIPPTTEQLQPLLIAPVLQLFAYHVATEKGLDVDRPRNLAKSVTVE